MNEQDANSNSKFLRLTFSAFQVLEGSEDGSSRTAVRKHENDNALAEALVSTQRGGVAPRAILGGNIGARGGRIFTSRHLLARRNARGIAKVNRNALATGCLDNHPVLGCIGMGRAAE